MTTDPLRTELRALIQILQPLGIQVVVGGGYGLFLRYKHIMHSGEQTLMTDYPSARSTQDIDIFLTAEVIADSSKTALIRAALDQLGYVPSTPNLQFTRSIEYAGSIRQVKIDFLAAPITGEPGSEVQIKDFRMRPRGYNGLHAYVTPEALTVEENLLTVDIGGDGATLIVYLPHPFSYLVLKLFALRDQVEDEAREYGRYSAFDIFTTIATMTQREWEQATTMKVEHASDEQVVEAARIASVLFSNPESMGTLRLREHARATSQELSDEKIVFFLNNLGAMFATQ
jgi:hypothetical protein